ncbi:thioredoxin TrxC [Silvimonas iriomotensis]|uniref:Thioredoxin n=1 Tax=Silvimonas iriomotensis TaxID=449662 RepID=A0ABQ2P538_9NEIS|nr:thioredoxin TrxC [Silvimonas iriomotensis]GGP18031.1 thiol disulfide reductase thioredoxin [Silvimonas iriomotensis]
MQIACPHCHTQNRIDDERIAEGPTCGACHKPMFSGAPVAVTGEQFAVLNKQLKQPLVVDCWATWCGPCQAFAPAFASAAEHFSGKATFVKVDTDQEQALSASLRIRSIPTLLVFERGQEQARQSGAMSSGQFKAWLSDFF